jgi:RNA binding exosome subunit
MAAQAFNYQQEAARVIEALRRAFPENATIATSEGYLGRVHVKVVSERLNGMSEQEKQDYLWDVLRAEMGSDAQTVSFIRGYGTDEL